MRLAGMLGIRKTEEGEEVLRCGNKIVAEWAADGFNGKQITLHYWISDRKETDAAIKHCALEQILGAAQALYRVEYSEITGYLWTDENFRVGGHDMIERLRSHIGKYLLLEVEVQ
jgi:hypothetical protein